MDFMKISGRGLAGLAFLLAGIFLIGCADPYQYNPLTDAGAAGGMSGTNFDITAYTIVTGDELTVSFSDAQGLMPITDTVKEDGTITLLYNHPFHAAGKKVGDLQKEIVSFYVPTYYKYLTPTIKLQSRYFTVNGEVRNSNRYVYTGQRVTVTQAIAMASGFTDFANKKNVKLIRASGKQSTINCVKAITDPSLDLEVLPGDQIYVKKRIF